MRSAAPMSHAFDWVFRNEPSYLGREHYGFAPSIQDGGAAEGARHRSAIAVTECGQHDHADTLCAIVIAKSTGEFEAVDGAARVRVGDEHVDTRGAREVDGAVTVGHGNDVEADGSQEACVALPRRVIAVDQKDADDHVGERSLACAPRTAHRRNG
jgi:hypothetical protein